MEKFARAMAKACRLKLEQNEEKKRKKKIGKSKGKVYTVLYLCVLSGSRLGPTRLLSVTLSKKCYNTSVVLGMYLMLLRGSLNMHAACYFILLLATLVLCST